MIDLGGKLGPFECGVLEVRIVRVDGYFWKEGGSLRRAEEEGALDGARNCIYRRGLFGQYFSCHVSLTHGGMGGHSCATG